MDIDGPVPTPLPSAKSGRPPPTLAKFSSSAPRPIFRGRGGHGRDQVPLLHAQARRPAAQGRPRTLLAASERAPRDHGPQVVRLRVLGAGGHVRLPDPRRTPVVSIPAMNCALALRKPRGQSHPLFAYAPPPWGLGRGGVVRPAPRAARRLCSTCGSSSQRRSSTRIRSSVAGAAAGPAAAVQPEQLDEEGAERPRIVAGRDQKFPGHVVGFKLVGAREYELAQLPGEPEEDLPGSLAKALLPGVPIVVEKHVEQKRDQPGLDYPLLRVPVPHVSDLVAEDGS
eukprot:scaffold21581_cov101-Isochrysis_galbana.AAC.3